MEILTSEVLLQKKYNQKRSTLKLRDKKRMHQEKQRSESQNIEIRNLLETRDSLQIYPIQLRETKQRILFAKQNIELLNQEIVSIQNYLFHKIELTLIDFEEKGRTLWEFFIKSKIKKIKFRFFLTSRPKYFKES